MCCAHRVAEGVELYLDLLADLQSDPQHAVKQVEPRPTKEGYCTGGL